MRELVFKCRQTGIRAVGLIHYTMVLPIRGLINISININIEENIIRQIISNKKSQKEKIYI